MTARHWRRRTHVLLTAAGAAGIALVFLPFTFGTVPLTDVILDDASYRDWQLWFMVLPCVLLPFVITAAQAARLAGWYSQRMTAAGFGLAGTLAVLYLGAVFRDMGEYEWMIVAGLSTAAFAAGAWLCARGIRRGAAAPELAALQLVYLVPMSFWLGFAHDDFEVGAWLGAVTSVTYLAQIGLAARRPLWTAVLAAPLALLMLYVVGGT